MSAEAVGYVFRYSPMTGAAFAVHLAIADSVNDQNENEYWARLPNLARKARVNPGTARKAVAKLIERGFLEVLDDGRPSDDAGSATSPRRFLFLTPSVPDVVAPRPRRGRGARPARARAVGAGTRADDAGTRAVGASDLEPKVEPKGNEPLPPPPAPEAGGQLPLVDVPASKRKGKPPAAERPHAARAREITAKVWERRNPKPASPFVAAAAIAERLLDAGHDDQAVGRAMVKTTTLTLHAIEHQLGLDAGKGGQSSRSADERQGVQQHDDTAPVGRITIGGPRP